MVSSDRRPFVAAPDAIVDGALGAVRVFCRIHSITLVHKEGFRISMEKTYKSYSVYRQNTPSSTNGETKKRRRFENQTAIFLWVRCGKSSSWRFESNGTHKRSQTNSFFWELRSQGFEIVSYVANRIWKSSESIV